MPDNEFSPCSIEHQDVYMYEDENSAKCNNDRAHSPAFMNEKTGTCTERAESPTYLDISSSKSAAFPHMKTGRKFEHQH